MKNHPPFCLYTLGTYRRKPSSISLSRDLGASQTFPENASSLGYVCNFPIRKVCFSGACNCLLPLLSVWSNVGSLALQQLSELSFVLSNPQIYKIFQFCHHWVSSETDTSFLVSLCKARICVGLLEKNRFS